jgi:hypothetical protein
MRIWSGKPLDACLWALTAALLAGAAVWPSWAMHGNQTTSRRMAERALHRIADSERALHAAHQHYAGFASSGPGRQAALPDLDLGEAARDFDFDAIVDQRGILHVRAVANPEGIRQLRVFPDIAAIELGSRSAATP